MHLHTASNSSETSPDPVAARVSPRYNAHAQFTKIPLKKKKKLASPMHLLCIHPVRIEFLSSDFKEQGYSSRQMLEWDQ